MEIPRLTVSEVTEMLARGERLAFVDARSAEAYGAATEHVPGSARVAPDDIDRRAGGVPRQGTTVAYCT